MGYRLLKKCQNLFIVGMNSGKSEAEGEREVGLDGTRKLATEV